MNSGFHYFLFTFLQEQETQSKEDTYRVVRPDLFTYKGEKPPKSTITYEQYILSEATKHKEVGATEYITLMFAIQSIALECKDILTYQYRIPSGIEGIRKEMKEIFVRNLSDC